jgi:hypothetical protein
MAAGPSCCPGPGVGWPAVMMCPASPGRANGFHSQRPGLLPQAGTTGRAVR